MTDKIPAYLRTVVPAIWGTFVAWLLATFAMPEDLATTLNSEEAALFVTAVVTWLAILAWYALGRWLEKQRWIPQWLVRLIMGSSQTPTYLGDQFTETVEIATVQEEWHEHGVEDPADPRA